MEEDIKQLERKIELNKQMYLEFGRLLSLDEDTVNAIENLINKYKEVSQKLLDNRDLFHENMRKAEKEIDRLRNKIADLEINAKEYERREKAGNENMVATLEESLNYCLEVKKLEEQNKELEKENKQCNKYWGNKIAEYHKVIELMAENIYNTSDTLNMLDIGKEINYDLEKLFNGIDDKEALKIIIDYFRKKAKGE